MADKLTFSLMTWDLLEEKHGVTCRNNQLLFEGCPQVEPSPTLVEVLRRARRFRFANERARAYRLIDPVLAELDTLRFGQISTIPEPYLEVPGMEGLCGIPDFVLSGSPSFKLLPIVTIVEAKKDDVDGGLPQCAAELYAAYLLNDRKLPVLHGCVTSGLDWKFLRLDGTEKRISVDADTVWIGETGRLLGILCHMVDTALFSLFGTNQPAT